MKEKKSPSILLVLLYILPKNAISRFVGGVASLRLPGFLMRPLRNWFIRKYTVNIEEAEKPPEEYPSLNLFFIRKLKPGARRIDPGPRTLVSPVDGRVSAFGKIEGDRMIQAKGFDYGMEELLACSDYSPRFRDGVFLTIYLSPPDYHRIHSPADGKAVAYSLAPGKLFPVNDLAVHGIRGLFPRNERLTTFLETAGGLIALVKVGAMNVGSVRVEYERELKTNRAFSRPEFRRYEEARSFQKGEELARFEMGSTVVMLFEKDAVALAPELREGMKIRLGEKIGEFTGGSGQ